MTRLITLIMCSGLALAASPAAAPQAGDWTVLLGEKSLDAWKNPSKDWIVAGDVMLDPDNPKLLKTKPGTGVFVNGPKGRLPDLLTKEDYSDIEVHLEFNIPKGSNSGIKFCGLYEIQILDSFGVKKLKGSDCGGIYPKAELKPKYKYLDDGVPPRTNACKQAGEWQTLDAIFVAPRFGPDGKKTANARLVKAVLNGELIHENVELLHPTGSNWVKPEIAKGPILLQADHGPVAFRNVRVRPYVGDAQEQKKIEVGPQESEKLRAARLEMDKLRHDGYGPEHYKVKALQKQIDQLRKSAGAQMDRIDADWSDSAKLLAALLERHQLLESGYGPDHPKVNALQSKIDSLRKAGVKVEQKKAAEELLVANLELIKSRHDGYGPKHAKIIMLEGQVKLLRAEDVRIDRQRAMEELEKLVRRVAELQDIGYGDAHQEVRGTYALIAYLAGLLAKADE
jgi:3-keto-disaccharide hydrolase